MKIRFEIILAALFGFGAICMNCNPSKKLNTNNLETKSDTAVKLPLFETHWTLIEMLGKPVPDSPSRKEMFIIFREDQRRAEGNGGCNAFSGTYELKNHEISFGPLVSTKMFCPGLKFENEFFKTLSASNQYHINGDTLSLTKGKKLTLAKFVAKRM